MVAFLARLHCQSTLLAKTRWHHALASLISMFSPLRPGWGEDWSLVSCAASPGKSKDPEPLRSFRPRCTYLANTSHAIHVRSFPKEMKALANSCTAFWKLLPRLRKRIWHILQGPRSSLGSIAETKCTCPTSEMVSEDLPPLAEELLPH